MRRLHIMNAFVMFPRVFLAGLDDFLIFNQTFTCLVVTKRKVNTRFTFCRLTVLQVSTHTKKFCRKSDTWYSEVKIDILTGQVPYRSRVSQVKARQHDHYTADRVKDSPTCGLNWRPLPTLLALRKWGTLTQTWAVRKF